MVKKGVMIIVVMIILCLSVSFASNDAIAIYINNSKIEFADVLPFIDENNRTLIPVRFISESLDASVKWISDTRTVKILKNDTIIELEIDSNIAKVNGKSIIMDTKAVIINNRTIVPLRFISEVLDFDINYKFDYDDRDDNIKRHIVDIYNLELKLATELRNMNNQDIDVSEYNLKISDMNNLNEKMIDEFPDVYFINEFVYSYEENDNNIISIRFIFNEDVNILKEKYDELVIKSDQIINTSISDNMTDYEKELALHDYLTENIKYDEKNAYPFEAHTAYGALINGIAVCDGYAEAFDYLLKKVSIKSNLIYGQIDNELHAWNLVEIDGKKYFVDVTADDPLNNLENKISYNFFNLMYQIINKTHTFEKDYFEVNNIEDNYFYKNNLLFINEKDVISYIERKLEENMGKTRLYFMLSTEILNLNFNVEDIVEEYIFLNSSLFTGSYSYVTRHLNCDMIFDMDIDIERK